MNITTILLRISILTAAFMSWATAEPQAMWAIDAGDNRRNMAGYNRAPGIETHTVYLATPEDGAYHHHPFLLFQDGVFYAAFSECRSGEDGPGQRVRVTTSADGKKWGRSTLALDAVDDYSLDWKDAGRLSTPVAWIVADERAWVISKVTDVIGFADRPGSREIVSQTRKSGMQRVQVSLGFLAAEVKPDGTVGERVWMMDCAPELTNPVPCVQYPALSESRFDDLRDSLLAAFREIESPPRQIRDTGIADDGHFLAEHAFYRRPDGRWGQLARDLNYSHRLYHSVSADGQNYSTPVQTNIPDSPSKTTAGTLPDGTVYIIGNFVHNPGQDATRKHYKRYPLVIALSPDGKVFDRAYAIRSAPTEPRFEVGGSSDGYQYPDAVLVENDLWVIYSINKQDIAISRVPWKDL
jgi:hypothetical protein